MASLTRATAEVSPTTIKLAQMGLFAGLLPWNAVTDLRKKGVRSTAQRLLLSRHVADLRLVISIFLALLISAVIVLAFHVAENDFSGTSLRVFVAVNGATAALFVSLFSWVFQTGSKRLGVVDLFACEIAAICRVYAIVGLAQRLVEAYDSGQTDRNVGQKLNNDPGYRAQSKPQKDPVANPTNMKINESYTPVMDHNVGDLQALDAEVVTNVTEFYTYRRAMLDFMYRWGQELSASALDGESEKRRRYYLKQTIHMLLLSLESARHALDDLIEFEPNHAEACINILLEELPTYAFLMLHTKDDIVRHKRLALRLPDYESVYESLYHNAKRPHENDAREWLRARTTAEDLKTRYENVMAELRPLRVSDFAGP